MHALAPLLFIAILINSAQLKKDVLYRANVFALLGISYFAFLQYSIYWYRIFPSQSVTQYIPGLIVVFCTVGLALSAWNRRSHPYKTLLLCSAFGLVLGGSFAFDSTIKEKLAEAGGFFEGGISADFDTAFVSASQMADIPTIGARLSVASDWQRQQAPSGHTYFTLDVADEMLVEVRPNCVDEFNMDTPTYVFNVLHQFEAQTQGSEYSYQCAIKNALKTCFVQVAYASDHAIKQRWQFLKIGEGRSRAAIIDFLIMTDSVMGEENLLAAMASLQFMDVASSEPCRTPAAWL